MVAMDDGDGTITQDDLELLNRTAMARTGSVARIASWALIGIGAVGALAWLWLAVRQQQQASDTFPSSTSFAEGPGLPFTERLSLLAGSMSMLMFAALVAGLGLVARVVGDHVTLAAGVSPLGIAVGDPWPTGAAPDEEV